MKFRVLKDGNVVVGNLSKRELKAYVTAYRTAALRGTIPKENVDYYLGIDLKAYAGDEAKDMDPIEFLEALKRCAKESFDTDL